MSELERENARLRGKLDQAEKINSDTVRQELNISTSKTHVRSIYRKLGVISRTQLTIKAIQLNLVAKRIA